MSEKGPEADIEPRRLNVAEVPIADARVGGFAGFKRRRARRYGLPCFALTPSFSQSVRHSVFVDGLELGLMALALRASEIERRKANEDPHSGRLGPVPLPCVENETCPLN